MIRTATPGPVKKTLTYSEPCSTCDSKISTHGWTVQLCGFPENECMGHWHSPLNTCTLRDHTTPEKPAQISNEHPVQGNDHIKTPQKLQKPTHHSAVFNLTIALLFIAAGTLATCLTIGAFRGLSDCGLIVVVVSICACMGLLTLLVVLDVLQKRRVERWRRKEVDEKAEGGCWA